MCIYNIFAYLKFMTSLKPGVLLIADPFLKDPYFERTVILLCECNSDGGFGFVINKNVRYFLDDLVDDLKGFKYPVFYGGPVQLDTVHFIHTLPLLITGGVFIGNGMYWGGDFSIVKALIKGNNLPKEQIRFFVGYSGWDAGQLESELNEKTWLTVMATKKIVFNTTAKLIWPESIKLLGAAYLPLINYPKDPLLN